MEDSWLKAKEVEHIFQFTKEFKDAFPYFLSIGMSYNEFWNEDVEIAQYYLKAFKISLDRKKEETDWFVWKQGVYVYEALCYASPVLHAFAKKGTKPLPYPEVPHGKESILVEIKEKESKREPTNQEIENERMKAKIFFNNWSRAVSSKFKGKR